jgi:hypothetical protein
MRQTTQHKSKHVKPQAQAIGYNDADANQVVSTANTKSTVTVVKKNFPTSNNLMCCHEQLDVDVNQITFSRKVTGGWSSTEQDSTIAVS